jgi:phage gp29-like protein
LYFVKNNKMKKPSSGLTRTERSKIVKQAKRGKKFGKKTSFKDVEKKAMETYGSKKIAKKVAGSVFWKAQARKKRKK